MLDTSDSTFHCGLLRMTHSGPDMGMTYGSYQRCFAGGGLQSSNQDACTVHFHPRLSILAHPSDCSDQARSIRWIPIESLTVRFSRTLPSSTSITFTPGHYCVRKTSSSDMWTKMTDRQNLSEPAPGVSMVPIPVCDPWVQATAPNS